MKVSVHSIGLVQLGNIKGWDVAVMVTEGEGEGALEGHALCTVNELMTPPGIASAVVALANAALGVLERKRKEARLEEHREALKAIWWTGKRLW